MNLKSLVIYSAVLLVTACASKPQTAEMPATPVTPIMTGNVRVFLSNPHGDVDGLILQDGTQVRFAPRKAGEVREVIAVNDRVALFGSSENNKIFHADKITNLSNSKSIDAMTPPMAPERPIMPESKKEKNQAGLKSISVKGVIGLQIFNPEGQVSGVVLNDNTVVLFSSATMQKNPANLNVGQNLRASGYGTQNAYGKSIEASEISNR